MKNFKTKKSLFRIVAFTAILMLIFISCGEDDCKYNSLDNNPAVVIPIGCDLSASIALTTGLNTDGALLAPGDNVVDPYWKVLNNPPLLSCINPLTATINGNPYVINYGGFGPSAWVNQQTASTLAPMNLGTTNGFGCNNASNALGIQVPYVFERSFCVLKNTSVDGSFTYKGDDQIYFELINNSTNAVINTSLNYIYPNNPYTWSFSDVALSSGSYSVRGYLINTSSVVLGFSFAGNLTTTAGDEAISNNNENCCQNNTISILNILESNCDGIYNAADEFGTGWTFTLRDASNTVIRTGTINANGNLFLSGLDDGTYKVSTTAIDGYTTSSPAGGSITVTISNNTVKVVEFYNCH